MTIAIAVVVLAIIMVWHRRDIAAERERAEIRYRDLQSTTNAQALRLFKQQESAQNASLTAFLAVVDEMTQARVMAAEERVQLANRIAPHTYQPPLSQSQDPAIAMIPAVGFDDDAGAWKAMESRDDIVRRLEEEQEQRETEYAARAVS